MTTTPFKPTTIIRPNIADLKPYTPIMPFEILSRQLGRHPDDIVKLDANENPYGPGPLVAEALAEAAYLHIYPDPESRELRKALADYTGIGTEYLLVGHGADELIDLIIRLFIEPGDVIVNCPPTFGMYAFDAAVNGAQIINVWRYPNFSINIDEIERLFLPLSAPSGESDSPWRDGNDDENGGDTAQAPRPAVLFSREVEQNVPKIIFISSPNNPDGSRLGDEELKQLLSLPAIIVLDEAYIEFSGGSCIQWVREYTNLIVLRTFSKWAGLAGLRVGYGAFPLDIIEQLWKIKQPYNVNVAGQIAAQASLADRKRLRRNITQLLEERERFYTSLAQFDWLKPYPSQTNFVLCRIEGRTTAQDVKQKLMEQGILVRYYNSPGLTDHIRISMGTPTQMARLEEALKAF